MLTSIARGKTSFFFQKLTRRNLLAVHTLKGAHDAFKHSEDAKRFSLYNGAIYDSHITGIIPHLYDLAKHDQSKGQPSATSQLLLSLYYRFTDDEVLRPTYNKSLPGWSLSPAIIADILIHLERGTFKSAREQICKAWLAEHYKLTGGHKGSQKKTYELLDIIAESYEEGLQKKQPAGMTSRILLAFFFQRAESDAETQQYYEQILASGIELDINKIKGDTKLQPDALCEDALLKEYRHTSKEEKEDFLRKNAEKIYQMLLADHHSLPSVEIQHFGYKGQAKRPDCFESMLRSFCNILLFDHETGQFNFSKLPKTIQPDAALIAFYKADNFQTIHMNTPKMGQAFFDLMSGREGVGLDYLCNDYEILGNLKSFIAAINMLFGIHAECVEDLSHIFSDERRKVIFSTHQDGTATVITVTLQVENGKQDTATLRMSQGHCTISSSLLGYTGSARHERIFLTLSRGAGLDMKQDPLLFTLYAATKQYYPPNLYPREYYFNEMEIDEIDRLHLIALCLNPNTQDEAKAMITYFTKACEKTPNAFLENTIDFLKMKFMEIDNKHFLTPKAEASALQQYGLHANNNRQALREEENRLEKGTDEPDSKKCGF